MAWSGGYRPAHLGNLIRRIARPKAWLVRVLFRSDLPGLVPAADGTDRIREVEEGDRTAITIVAHSRPFVIGVDTHARNHVYAIITARTGELIATRDFPATGAGINGFIAWVARHTGVDLGTLWVIVGTGSYGALLAGAAGYQVAEAARMDTRSGTGSANLTRSTRTGSPQPSCLDEQHLRRPRLNDGVRAALRVLVTAGIP